MNNRLSEFQAAAAAASGAHSPVMSERLHSASPPPSSSARRAPQQKADLEMGVVAAHSSTSMEHFLAAIEQTRVRLDKINKTIGEVEHLHRQALSAVSAEEASRLGRVINELVSRNNAEAQLVRRALKDMTGETETLKETGSVSSSDLRMRTTQQSRYAKKFMDTMNRFQGMQTTYQAKYRQQLERQYLIVKPSATREELERLSDFSDGPAALNQQIFAMANRAQAQKTFAEMRERQDDIMSIERSIKELHQMFVDMAMIVEQQGEMIDKVGDHINNTLEYTEQAAIEMRGAVVRQRSIQKKKWILLIVCTILLVAIGITLWLTIYPPGTATHTPPPARARTTK